MNIYSKFEKIRETWLGFEEFKIMFQKVEVEEYPNNVLIEIPEPLISVHISTYQHAHCIRESIESVLQQKLDIPWEIVIGDDESTDGTREICIEYARKYPNTIRLFLHKRENNISVLGTNCGIFQIVYNTFKCRGKYVAVCSGDDYWSDSLKLSKQYGIISYNDNYSYVYGSYKSKVIIDGLARFGDTESKMPKASTILYRNVFSKLPKEMLHSINEDVFFQEISSLIGDFCLVDSCGPTVYLTCQGNLWNNNSIINKKRHQLNTYEQLYKCLGRFSSIYKKKYSWSMVHNGDWSYVQNKMTSYRDLELVVYYLKYYLYKLIKI